MEAGHFSVILKAARRLCGGNKTASAGCWCALFSRASVVFIAVREATARFALLATYFALGYSAVALTVSADIDEQSSTDENMI
jgi:hypothetical protein